MSPAAEHAARMISPPKVRIVLVGGLAGASKPIFEAPGPAGPAAPCAPRGPVAPIGPCGPRAPRIVGTTELGSFAFRPSGTSRPGFGVRDALIPLTAPAFRAKAAIERLADPPAGDAARTASRSAAPAAAMIRMRTRDLLDRE